MTQQDVLDLLEKHKQLTSAELAKKSGVGQGSISQNITKLVAQDLVMEVDIIHIKSKTANTPVYGLTPKYFKQ